MAGKKGRKSTGSKGGSDPVPLTAEPSAASDAQMEAPDDLPAAAAAASAEDASAAPDAEPAPAEGQEEDTSAGDVPAPASPPAAPQASTSGPDPQLQQQLAEAHSEIQSLRAQLADRAAEVSTLRSELASRPAAGAAAAAPPPAVENGRTPEDMARLQERLTQLRKDQADADGARDAAWRQLKAVVADISRLAAPPEVRASTVMTPS